MKKAASNVPDISPSLGSGGGGRSKENRFESVPPLPRLYLGSRISPPKMLKQEELDSTIASFRAKGACQLRKSRLILRRKTAEFSSRVACSVLVFSRFLQLSACVQGELHAVHLVMPARALHVGLPLGRFIRIQRNRVSVVPRREHGGGHLCCVASAADQHGKAVLLLVTHGSNVRSRNPGRLMFEKGSGQIRTSQSCPANHEFARKQQDLVSIQHAKNAPCTFDLQTTPLGLCCPDILASGSH